MQPSLALNVSEPRRLGWDQPIGDTELLTEGDAFGLLREDRIRSAVDDELANLFAQNHAASARRTLQDHERQAAFVQLEGRTEPCNPAAHDNDVDEVRGVDGIDAASRLAGVHSRARTSDSRAPMNVGDVLSDVVRRNVAPAWR